jgi:hypothetical protein
MQARGLNRLITPFLRGRRRAAPAGPQDVRSAIPSLFRGSWSYVTTCRACGRESAASAQATDYYEMPVQVGRLTAFHWRLTGV